MDKVQEPRDTSDPKLIKYASRPIFVLTVTVTVKAKMMLRQFIQHFIPELPVMVLLSAEYAYSLSTGHISFKLQSGYFTTVYSN